MGKQMWNRLTVLSIFLLSLKEIRVFANSQVPCYFIFGDSLSDSGNNNNRDTSAKVNYSPYGIDFPNSVPTGRFTNSLNIADFIGQKLGFQNLIPPYVSASGQSILQGVNYASGGAGIRDETGSALGDIIPLDEQLLNHKRVINRIISLLRNKNSAEALLNKCIYTVNIGSNDYLNNYLLPRLYPSSRLFTPDQYAGLLIRQLKSQLKTLYRDGARKIAVFSVGFIGCTPYARANFDFNGSFCVDRIDNITNLFNIRLKSLVIELNANLRGANLTFINSRASSSTGQLIIDRPCCPLADDGIQCARQSTPCPNRDQYVFYDGVHPTSIASLAAADNAYFATTSDAAYPYSISQLAHL